MEESINTQNLLSLLESKDPSERSGAIESVMFEEWDDVLCTKISSLLQDEDKGVRNVVSMALTVNGNPSIPEKIIGLVSAKDISIRNLAGEVLLKIGVPSIPALIDYIPKGDHDDKKFVVDILGLIKDHQSSEAILNLLKVTDDDNIVLACVEALGNIQCDRCLDYLAKVYEQNELFRPTVIEAMGKIGSKAALDFMQKIYKSEDELTKFSIIESFGLIGDESIFFFLLSELNNLEGALVYPVLASIYALKEKYQFDIPFDERMKNIILNTLIEAEPQYKKVAALLVSEFNDKEIILACLKIWGTDTELDDALKPKFLENPAVIIRGIIELLQKGEENLRSLLYLLQDILIYEGIDFNSLLGPIELRNLTDSFTRCLENPDEEVRKTSMELLFHIDRENAFLFLDTMLNDDNLWNRLKLLEILDSIDNENSTAALRKLADDPEEMINERAKMILETRTN